MEPLARWIRKEVNRELPWPYIVILLLTCLPCSALPALALFPNQNPNSTFSIVLILLIAAAGLIPAITHVRKNRHRPKMVPLARAHALGRLREMIGPRFELLNRAAADLEQIVVTLELHTDTSINKKGVIQVAESRMRRMLELAIGVPANYALTQEAATRQIEADGKWLDHARQVCERFARPSSELPEDDARIRELQELATARDMAIDELEIRG